MKNTIIFILTLFVIVSIYALKSESDKYKGYLQGIVKVIDTKQTKITCKESEDPYFFTYNTVGSTSPDIPVLDREAVIIGAVCIDRITQEEKSLVGITFMNPLQKGDSYIEAMYYNYDK